MVSSKLIGLRFFDLTRIQACKRPGFSLNSQIAEQQLFCLYAEEDAVLVEKPEDEEKDGDVTEADEEVVIVTDILFQAKEEGTAHTLETDDVADDIGGDAVHSIDFQEGEVPIVTTIIYPPVEQAHEQETITTADEHHRACPNVLDDGVYKIPGPAE